MRCNSFIFESCDEFPAIDAYFKCKVIWCLRDCNGLFQPPSSVIKYSFNLFQREVAADIRLIYRALASDSCWFCPPLFHCCCFHELRYGQRGRAGPIILRRWEVVIKCSISVSLFVTQAVQESPSGETSLVIFKWFYSNKMEIWVSWYKFMMKCNSAINNEGHRSARLVNFLLCPSPFIALLHFTRSYSVWVEMKYCIIWFNCYIVVANSCTLLKIRDRGKINNIANALFSQHSIHINSWGKCHVQVVVRAQYKMCWYRLAPRTLASACSHAVSSSSWSLRETWLFLGAPPHTFLHCASTIIRDTSPHVTNLAFKCGPTMFGGHSHSIVSKHSFCSCEE